MSTSVTISATSGPQTSTEPCECCGPPPTPLDHYQLDYDVVWGPVSYHVSQTLVGGCNDSGCGYSTSTGGYPYLRIDPSNRNRWISTLLGAEHSVDFVFERFGWTPVGTYTLVSQSFGFLSVANVVVS